MSISHNAKSTTFLSFFLLCLSIVFSINIVQAQETCNCIDYLYVNDPSLDVTHKFALNPDGSVGNEIYSSGTTPWLAPNVITNAHGVVSDIAGNLYISQIDTDPTVLYQVGCDGTIKSSDYIPNWDRTLNLVTVGTVLYSIGRDPNGGDYHIYSHDLCSQSDITSIALPAAANGSTSSWGLTLGSDGELYFTQTFGATNTNDHCVYHVDAALTTITQVFCLPNLANHHTFGVAQDECGNFYVVVTETTPGSTTLYKVDASGNIISSITDTALDGTGYGGAWGLVYNEPSGKLYIGTLGDDCVAVVDAGGCGTGPLIYEGNSGVPHVPGTYSKAVNIQRECCPIVNNVVIDTFVCGLPVGGMVGLATLIECADGIMCGAEWEEIGDSPALMLDNCLQSATAIMAEGCGSYMLTTPPNGACAPSTISVDVGFASIDAGSLGADLTICESENPPAIPVVTNATATNTIVYQWQQSTLDCNSGFIDIAGATTQNYNPPALTTTTYYRLMVSVDGCNMGSCVDVTNCYTVTVVPDPVAAVAGTPFDCNGYTDDSATATVSGGTPGYTYLWDDPSSQTTATATGLAAGTYMVTVTDANGCMDVQSITVTGLTYDVPCFGVGISRN